MASKNTTVRIVQRAAPMAATLAPGLASWWLERLFLTPKRWPTPPRELDWIASMRSVTIPFDERRSLRVLCQGSGPTVLLVHGWTGRGSQMGAFIEPLLALGARVVTFDAPAHGRADGTLTGLPEIAEAVMHVSAEFGPVRALIAHSLGTAATSIAVSRGVGAERLVYIAPPNNPGDYLQRAGRYLRFGDEVARRAKARIERRFGYRFEEARGASLAASIDVPLFVVHDVEDKDVPYEEGAELVSSWTGAELMTTRGLGHRRVLRDPRVVSAVTRFLAPLVEAYGSGSGRGHTAPSRVASGRRV